MKKKLHLFIILGLLLSACLPDFLQPDATSASPTPLSETDLQSTAAVLSDLTLQALPTPTVAPSQTPVVRTATNSVDSSEEPPSGPASGATLPLATASSAATQLITSLAATSPNTPPGFAPTPTETLHPRFYGTLPPNLPSGKIILVNKSKKEVYISLQCTTKDGYMSILEYPVPHQVETRAPAGKYLYVAWVGGKKLTGNFSLGAQGEIRITIFKDSIGIK